MWGVSFKYSAYGSLVKAFLSKQISTPIARMASMRSIRSVPVGRRSNDRLIGADTSPTSI
jgi:hypothetical protein